MVLNTLTRCCVCTLAIGIALAETGCRRRDPYTDGVMEITRAEKIDLEDQIYALEDKLAEKERELESLRGRTPTSKPARTPRSPATKPPAVMDDADLLPPSIDPGVPIEPKIELPPIEATPKRTAPATPAPKPPVRSMKPASATTDEALLPPGQDEDTQDVSEDLPPPEEKPSFRKPQVSEPELVDPQVSSVFINPFHTTGVELDQQPGDDGITILFEPRNAAGQFVPQTGEVAIVVLDPALEGEAARVARWELSKTEVSKRMLDARPERGVKVQLKWPEKRPEHAKLKLFVRYHAADGRQIEGHSDVFVTLPGQISQRWTPSRK